jgi:protein-disulfide isomerase
MTTKFSRRMASFAAVAALTLASGLIARGRHAYYEPTAPAYRVDGPADAKVVVAEFSDFQCPACRYAEPTVRQMRQLYRGRIRFVFKHFPLHMHEWAMPAAVAAECAGRQDKFWPYHDLLYDRQDEWTNAKYEGFLTGYARKAGLDLKAWEACRAGTSAAAAVRADEAEGTQAWVNSTPTFFIDGVRFIGGKQLGELGTLRIDKELKTK